MEQFFMRLAVTLAGAILIGTAGCSSNNGNQSPPANSSTASTPRQAKDVGSAIDEMAADLLTVPQLNAVDGQWTIVIADVNNRTTDPKFTYEIFSQRLAATLGSGRIVPIENRAKHRDAGGARPAATEQIPDYSLNITIEEMPKPTTRYYQITATLTNLETREQVWVSPPYEVQTSVKGW
jgi:hypothetical protein